MKEIKAVIQPFMLTEVIDALKEMQGLPGVTVSEVQGFGKGRARSPDPRVAEHPIGYAKKIKIEIVVPDELAESVVELIREKAHTGRVGDGKIFVLPVDEVYQISGNATGPEAV